MKTSINKIVTQAEKLNNEDLDRLIVELEMIYEARESREFLETFT